MLKKPARKLDNNLIPLQELSRSRQQDNNIYSSRSTTVNMQSASSSAYLIDQNHYEEIGESQRPCVEYISVRAIMGIVLIVLYVCAFKVLLGMIGAPFFNDIPIWICMVFNGICFLGMEYLLSKIKVFECPLAKYFIFILLGNFVCFFSIIWVFDHLNTRFLENKN